MYLRPASWTVCPGLRRPALGFYLCLGLLLIGASARAEVEIPAGLAQTHTMAGGFALLREPGQTDPYQSISDPSLFPSFPVWFDTGASGDLISYYVASDLNIPTTGQTYEDIGIGGNETFDVSQPTQVLLVPSLKQPTYNDITYADQMASYSSYGNLNLQLRQADKWLVETLIGYYNIVGTPVLNNYVMRVRPNSLVHQFDAPLLGGPYPMLYMETALLDSLPDTLPTHRTVYVPLTYTDFISGDPPVSVADNPVIPGVRLSDGSFSGSGHDWLMDSGATVTIISKLVAGEIGLDANTPVVSTAAIGGIGSATINLNGYEIDELILPSTDETTLTLTDAVVYVIDWSDPADLPVELPGIFGMNLLNKSIDNVNDGVFIDPLLGIIYPEYLTDSIFDEWFVDPFNSQLVLLLADDGSLLPGDVTEDGFVGGDDLSIILTNWGQSGMARYQGDLTGDGFIGGDDYTEVLTYWGTGTPLVAALASVPEPTVLLLVTFGALAFLSRRMPKRA